MKLFNKSQKFNDFCNLVVPILLFFLHGMNWILYIKYFESVIYSTMYMVSLASVNRPLNRIHKISDYHHRSKCQKLIFNY